MINSSLRRRSYTYGFDFYSFPYLVLCRVLELFKNSHIFIRARWLITYCDITERFVLDAPNEEMSLIHVRFDNYARVGYAIDNKKLFVFIRY